MIKSIVFIVSSPFNKRDYERFGIEILKNNGFDVVVWNLMEMLHPRVSKEIENQDQIYWENLIQISKLEQFKKLVYNLNRNSLVYTTLSFNLKTFSVFKTISDKNIPYCVSSINAAPFFIVYKTTSNLEKTVTKNKILLSYWVKKGLMKIFHISPAVFVTKLGLCASIKRPEVSSKTIILGIHSHDYDLFLSNSNVGRSTEKYAVYLDNYLPYHPDSLYSGEKNPITPKKYHDSLNRLFDLIEMNMNINIKIAAHPRSNYNLDFNPFNTREIIKNKTIELVKNAEFVILNFSTSVNFAVLYNKPCIFFTTNELENSIYKEYIKTFTKCFNSKPVNIDESFHFSREDIFKVDTRAYENYKFNYIKMPSTQNLPVWQLIANQIKSL